MYPRAVSSRSGLRTVAVVKDLAYAGQRRSAVPDPYKGVLYLDATCRATRAVRAPRDSPRVLPFHPGRTLRHAVSDRSHVAIVQPAGLPLRQGRCDDAQTRRLRRSTHPRPGFINLYAQSALEEDMAEVFAALRVPQERKLVERWAREDEVLRKKIEYLEAFFDGVRASGRPRATSRVGRRRGELI